MEFVSAIIGPIVESLIVPVKKQLGYFFSSTKHVRNMNTRMKQLDGKSTDVKKHKERNSNSNLEIPTRVQDWLEEVEETKKKAQSISSSNSNGCFDVKMRYKAGRNAFKIAKEIESLIEENSKMIWTDAKIPLGKVKSNIASTSAPSDDDGTQNHFKSREKSFKDALGFLQQDHAIQVIALCGMGGVGKTTMMEQLKKAVEDKKMFDYVVKVVIGQQVNMFSIQQAVADYITSQPLTESSVTARADRLRIAFENLPEGKRKVLVILDDVWETIELKDIGLSSLPNGFKLLLTSRNQNICEQIAANFVYRVVRVDVMKEQEAQNFFWQTTGVSKRHDQELSQIGSEIVRRCGFLPLAIKLIATTLKTKEANAWRITLHRLKENNLDRNVQKIIQISYSYIEEKDEKEIFLLCGLFPDDYNIPIEELTRYAWGLRLLSGVSNLGNARDWTKTCVQNLKSANLLMDSDYIGCVKLHDLVLAFVLGRVSKGGNPWLINHADTSKWRTTGMSDPCKIISIGCKGMSEFPRDFNYPNLSLLRLMDGDKSLRFPENFYEKMENLEVIAYDELQYPLLPRSLQCSTKLRTLLLDQCLLMFDCSTIGELLNLEVLSFAHCGIRILPSAIGKLEKLKLLDLTGCFNLRIDDGVLKNLVNLEEIYMRVGNQNAICFTDGNRAELAELSEHLFALEIEFFDKKGMPENMLFTNLARFRISMGCGLEAIWGLKMHSFENTLMLVTNKDELVESRINELFEETEVLYLEVDGMNKLEEVLVEVDHLPKHSLFNHLRVLDVFKCENLKNLFTVPMASSLMKLERLTVSKCPVLEVLAYSEDGGADVIKFQELKYLSLDGLPKLVGLCNTGNAIELPNLVEMRLEGLPNFTCIYAKNTSTTSSISSNISANQSFFNKEVLIPKLEILQISSMDKLKGIWLDHISNNDEANAYMLRKIEVRECDNLVNLFPRNPMSLLRHLEELSVSACGSLEVLFNIDMSCLGEIEEHTSNLRNVKVSNLGKLSELWRLKGESCSDILIRSFQAVERIEIEECERFVNVFTPTITNSDVRTLMSVSIDGRGPLEKSARNIGLDEKSQEIKIILQAEAEISEVCGNIPDIEFSVHHLQELEVNGCKDVEVVFEIESSSSRSNNRELTTTTSPHNHQPLLLPYLKVLKLNDMEKMSDVWKCNWKKLVIPLHQSQSSFHNLRIIEMKRCKSIKYLFSPLMGKLLPNLKKASLYRCAGIEEVVSNRSCDDENEDTSINSTHYTNTITSFPYLETLYLSYLPCIKSIDAGNAKGGSSSSSITSGTTFTTNSTHEQFKCLKFGVASWFISQRTKMIYIIECDALSRVFPSYVVGRLHKLEELKIEACNSMVEVFESEGVNTHTNTIGEGSNDACTAITIPRSANMTLLELPNLTILYIGKCDVLKYIFTSSTLESLKQLKELTVKECKAMQVIVKEDGETSRSIVVLPRLNSLTLAGLLDLKGFFLGMNEFRWPSLEKVKIYGCPQMMIFTSGQSTAPKLNYIHTGLGKHSLDECGLNFHLTHVTHKTQLGVCSAPDMIKLLQFPWSYSNLVEVDAHYIDKLLESHLIFPCNELVNLKNLEKLYITYTDTIEEVFEAVEGRDDDANETESVVVIEKLKEVTLVGLINLKHIWNSNRWIALKFPNLTKLSISVCHLLGHVFTGCMVGSLLQLQELQISYCYYMNVIVEDSETSATEVVFPCLKSITLYDLPNLKGFCLGKTDFVWPSLHTLEIKDCPEITVFTGGQSTTPELKLIDATFGLCDATEDPNSFIKTKQEEGWQL